MLFSSITFIYFFLPIILLFNYIIPKKYRNIPLLIFSLLFYFLSEPKYILILIFSCIVNFYLSILIYINKHSKLFLFISLTYNIGQLLYFKYIDFFITNINNIFNIKLSLLHIIMPIGISFYTFQIIAYIIDIYNKKHKPAKNLLTFITYVSLFPQLIAGPIVRYIDIEDELKNREYSFSKFSKGIKKFIIGLSKKVLIANVLGELIKELVTQTFISSWIKPILFTLQIYYDFSGYSDMAIGLGFMLGFTFSKNFNYPLIASSIKDFWRRWHISLSSWFKDYIYIPLGGNKSSRLKWFRNIIIVWILTGFWHGASWNFIIWGLYFAIFFLAENLFLEKYLKKTKIIKYLYTSLIIIISFLIFNSESINDILNSLSNMFYINKIPFASKETIYYLKSNIILIIISIIGATPILKVIINKIKNPKLKIVTDILEPIIYLILLTLTTAHLIDASFNPFLYFRF